MSVLCADQTPPYVHSGSNLFLLKSLKIIVHWLLVGIPIFSLLKTCSHQGYRKVCRSIHFRNQILKSDVFQLTTQHWLWFIICIFFTKTQENQRGVNWSCFLSYQRNSPKHITVQTGDIIYFSFHDYILE